MKEFGIYPTTREPQLWLGCRAIITNKTFDVPFDRWSESLRYKAGADDFISWVNHIAIPKIELCIKRGQKNFVLALTTDSLPVKLTIEIVAAISIAVFIAQKSMMK